jgi:hypothetical protein
LSDSDDKSKVNNSERRRISRIVHDERGNARVEWTDIPDERAGKFERHPLAVDATAKNKVPSRIAVERARAGGFNPYARAGTAGEPAATKSATGKRDLRKLGEWIKQMRQLEERRADGDSDEEK